MAGMINVWYHLKVVSERGHSLYCCYFYESSRMNSCEIIKHESLEFHMSSGLKILDSKYVNNLVVM